MMSKNLGSAIGSVLFTLVLAGCGSDSAAPVPAPAPAPTGIGPAGGAVNGPNGATIVVPAGALSQTVDLRIEQVDASARLPEGLTTAGAAYALTPHGTSFAQPVTVTIPFDPVQVPMGDTVQLLKTTDADRVQWSAVPGATATGAAVSAPVSAFSDFVVFVPRLPTITTQPAAVTVVVGDSASFSVAARANGLPPLTYQWQRDGVNIPGATGASYTLASAAASDDGALFSVIVGNGLGTVNSTQARLGVGSATGWATLGTTAFSGSNVWLGGLAVSRSGRVAVSYVDGGLIANGQVRVSEWDGTQWSVLGGSLNLAPNRFSTVGRRSIAYDRNGLLTVAWVERSTREIVVQQWNGAQWQRLGGPPLYAEAATLGDPQLQFDPVSNRPIVTITSGPNTSVREWNGAAWVPDNRSPSETLVISSLAILNNGQRLLARPRGPENGLWQARLYGPDQYEHYTVDFGGDIWTSAVPRGDDGSFTVGTTIATDGIAPYALTGNFTTGPTVVRRLTGAQWNTIGGDTGVRLVGGEVELHVTPFGLPLIAHQQGARPARRIDGLWWDGTAWSPVASPNDASVDVVYFTAALDAVGVPYVALAQAAPPNAPNNAQTIVVRRFAPVTLTVVASGPAGSGRVSSGQLECAAAATCGITLPPGTNVTLQAQPSPGYTLQSWAGCDTVVNAQCTVRVNGNQAVTATFQ